MSRLPWATRGARLHLPRDLHVAYAVGRMGVATAAHLWPLFWGAPSTARFGFARLVRLGLLRAFPRDDVSKPAWFALARDAAGWVADGAGCEEADLRCVSGIRRMNLAAVDMRNRLWLSAAQACRATGGAVSLDLFRPEWELRRLKPADARVVPDAQLVVADPGGERTYLVELDAGTERLAVWRAKAAAYLEARSRGPLYGAGSWRVLALVPSARRARSVATAVASQGAGAFVLLAETETLMDGRALDAPLYSAASLAAAKDAAPAATLGSG